MRISDWSPDVCSSDLGGADVGLAQRPALAQPVEDRSQPLAQSLEHTVTPNENAPVLEPSRTDVTHRRPGGRNLAESGGIYAPGRRGSRNPRPDRPGSSGTMVPAAEAR